MSTAAGTPRAPSTDFPPRRRGLPHTEAVVFVAPCPACGSDCEWREERHETRSLAIIGCPCTLALVRSDPGAARALECHENVDHPAGSPAGS